MNHYCSICGLKVRWWQRKHRLYPRDRFVSHLKCEIRKAEND